MFRAHCSRFVRPGAYPFRPCVPYWGMPNPSNTLHVQDGAALRRFADEKMQKVNLFETERMFCDLYCLQPGQAQKVHAHADADKVYFVLEGAATVIIGEDESTAHPQQAVLAPAGVPHGVRNDSAANVVCLVFMAPHPDA